MSHDSTFSSLPPGFLPHNPPDQTPFLPDRPCPVTPSRACAGVSHLRQGTPAARSSPTFYGAQTAQARDQKHRDALARQEALATVLAQMPGCVKRQAPGQLGIAGTSPEAAAVWGQATVTLEGDVALTLRGLSPQAACTLLRALHLAPRNAQGEGAPHDAHG
jgi:hypothetical protein